MPDYSQVQPLSTLVRMPQIPQQSLSIATQRTNIQGEQQRQESVRMQQEAIREQQLKDKQVQALVPFSLNRDGSLNIDKFYARAALIDLPLAEKYKDEYLKRDADSVSLSNPGARGGGPRRGLRRVRLRKSGIKFQINIASNTVEQQNLQ